MQPLHSKDSYKIDHRNQYAPGTSGIYANWTARSGKHSNIPGSRGVLFIGLQGILKEYFIEEWDKGFFQKDVGEVASKYKRRIEGILNKKMDVSHIYDLHSLGYLPIEIKALPEGSFVPYGVPMITFKETESEFFWLVNMLESVFSCEMWQPITSATTYYYFRNLFEYWADYTGSPKDFCKYQGHDFSMRGMSCRQAAAKSGFSVLAAGSRGTDNIPGIDYAEDYYQANSDEEEIGVSVPATEHSVMCSGGKNDERETFLRLITEVYPDGMVSVVSDTWDFWGVVTKTLPSLYSEIMGRDGKLIIRPDSGDPVKIICGDSEAPFGSPEYKGLIECLWETFGGSTTSKGFKVLDPHIGAIYGDSITFQRAKQILEGLATKGFASCNIVLGLGSYLFQNVTRDTHGFAMKTTLAKINGVRIPIFKDPKTDDGTKKSAKGYLLVTNQGGAYKLTDEVDINQEGHGCLRLVFRNSKLFNEDSLKTIRARVDVLCREGKR
jgi:nicotinamide phosphoribosyltransferase